MASEFNHGSGYNIGFGGTGTFYRKRLYWAHFYLGGQLYSEPRIWVPEAKTPLRPPPSLSFTPFSPHQLLAQIHCSFMRASHPQVLGTKCGFCLGPGILGLICGHIHPDALQEEGSLGPQRGMTHGHKEEDEGSRQLRRRIRCSVQSLQNQSPGVTQVLSHHCLNGTSHLSGVKWAYFRSLKALGNSWATYPSALPPPPLHCFVCLNTCFCEWEERIGGN